MIKTLRSFGLALLVLASFAQAQPLRTVQASVFREDPVMAIGRLKGFLAAEGVDVKVMITTSSTEQMRGLSKGTFQIASGSFDNVLGWSGREGAEIIAVAQGGDTTYFPIFANPEIKNWNDLRGKKLGVDAVDTAFSLVLRRVLLDKGLEFTKGDYQLVPVGGPSSELRRISRYYDNQYYDAATGR